MPRKPLIREDAASAKVKIVFDARAKPHYTFNDCFYREKPLYLAFLQAGIKEENSDAFRGLFDLKVDEQEELLRFTLVAFGAEASPFILQATLHYHYIQQPEEVSQTVQTLRVNTYEDNLIKNGQRIGKMDRFKSEATQILEEEWFPVQKKDFNLPVPEGVRMINASRIPGLN